MTREVYGYSFTLAILVALVSPVLVSAETLAPGCRLATPQDQAEMLARGIPSSFQVCPRDAQILGIGRDFEQWYAQIKAMSPCNRNTCTLSCRTRNTGAQVCGPTATRWNSIGCHANNKTAIFPTVSHGFAAHIELLRRYCGERGRCTIMSAIQQWAPLGHGNNQPTSYAAFVSRAAGIPTNQVYDPNNIDLMGRLAMAMACFEAGSLPYSAAELKQGLIMAGGGPRVPVPANVGALLSESLSGSYTATPSTSPNSHPGSWAYPQSSVSGNNYTPPPPPTKPLPVINTPAVTPTSPTNPTGANLGSSLSPNPGTPSTNSNAPPALIIAQPKQVSRGNSVVVSWSSVGMSATQPCQVYLQFGGTRAQVGQGNEGSRSLPTSAKTLTGTWNFSLQCTAPSGAAVQKTADLVVR